MKEILSKIRTTVLSWLLWLITTSICYTVRIRAVGESRLNDLIASGEGGILAQWHDRTMLSIFYCRNRGLWAIISMSKDGELQNRIVKSRGYQTIRGSSGGRKGIRAFLEASKKIREGKIVAITPDGPRGPAKVVQAGTVVMAGRAACKIIPIGLALDSAWLMNSWDKHAIAKPFSNAVIVFGEPITVDSCDTEEDRLTSAKMIADAINAVDTEAERILYNKESTDESSV